MAHQSKPVTEFGPARNVLLGRFRLATARIEKVIMDPEWNNCDYAEFRDSVNAMNAAIENIKRLNEAELSVNH